MDANKTLNLDIAIGSYGGEGKFVSRTRPLILSRRKLAAGTARLIVEASETRVPSGGFIATDGEFLAPTSRLPTRRKNSRGGALPVPPSKTATPLVRKINARRMALQHAADALWPYTAPENGPVRKLFKLPPDRPLNG